MPIYSKHVISIKCWRNLALSQARRSIERSRECISRRMCLEIPRNKCVILWIFNQLRIWEGISRSSCDS
ncbi:hypothetical protein LINPERHAP1_LOCUS41023 [Linum perenne]